MKKILLILMVMAVWASNALAVRAKIVVEDSTNVGVDTLLTNSLRNNLGYTVSYFDIDDVGATYNSAYFDTAADVYVIVGSEVALPSLTAQADSITSSTAGVVTLGPDLWDEINLGIMDASDERSTENTGYLLNIGQSHWITRGLADTIAITAVTNRIYYNMLFPDSSHDIVPLVIDPTYRTDTARVLACAADSNTQVFNTTGGVPGSVCAGRRVYLGIWQSLTTNADSCQWWSLFERAVSWAATDTLGEVMKRLCWSGKHELDWVSVVENSSGTDSIESYGNYDSNVGFDHDEKHLFCRVNHAALQRKVGNEYRSADVASAWFSLYYEGTSFTDYAEPTTWESGFSLRPIIRKWQIERKNCYYSATCPNACWTYAWKDTSATPDVDYAWTTGGARDTTDTRAVDYDTLVINQDTTLNTRVTLYVHPDSLETHLLDTTVNYGWASRMLLYSNSNGGADHGEMSFFMPGDNNNRTPRFNVVLTSFSTTEPTPTIAFDADSIVFTGIVGQTIAPQYVTISNSAGGALECLSITDDGGWLTLVESGTTTPITLQLVVTGQASGYTYATVTVGCADASNTPQTLKVVRNLTAAGARTAGGAVIIK